MYNEIFQYQLILQKKKKKNLRSTSMDTSMNTDTIR